MKRIVLLTIGYWLLTYHATAQDSSLLTSIDKDLNEKSSQPTIATFKSTRLVNGHTIETTGKGVLDFRIHHRFGTLNGGIYEFFGLDEATTYLDLDYGISNHFSVGISRSTYLKQVEGFLKYKVLAQKENNSIPLTVTALFSANATTVDIKNNAGENYSMGDKMAYVFQLLLARKFNDNTSFQIVPGYTHYGAAASFTEKNLFSMGFGARQKISKRVSLSAEYYDQFNAPNNGSYNAFAVGVDIETGGHVFQLHLTNANSMVVPTFIHNTKDSWGSGGIHFGFNISRAFVLKKPKEFKQ